MNTIDDSTEWSLHPFISHTIATDLSSSIEKIGLLQPPIFQKLASGRFQLLCGSSRLRTFKRTQPEQTSICGLVLEEETTPKQILFYVLEDQLLSGRLSPMEKGYFFHHCLHHMDIGEAAKTFLPILGEKVQLHTVSKLTNLLQLESVLQLSVHNEILNEKTAHELLNLDETDRRTLHTLFLELGLGGGKQKRLLTLSKDLAFREEKTITSLLAEAHFMDIRNHPEMNQPQKTTNIFSTLQKCLYPQSNAAEKSFLKRVQKLALPGNCSVSHSQAFEKNDISLTLHFDTFTKIEQSLPEIKALLQKR